MDDRGSDKNRLILGLKIATFLAAVLVVFRQDLAKVVVDALQNESTTYMLAIPFLFAYLIYRKRKMLRAVMPLESQAQPKVFGFFATIVGVLLASMAMLFYWLGSYTLMPLEYHMLTLPIFAAGLTLILFNTQTLRELSFPLAFLILLTPPSEILSNVGPAFSVISSEASYAFIRLVGIPSTLTSEYGNPVIQLARSGGQTLGFAVDVASSGIGSLLGFLVFGVFIGYIIRDKPWKKLALFLIGFPLIYVLSIARIATILLIGYNFGRDVAIGLFLPLGGLILIFLGTLLLLVFSDRVFHTQIFSRPSQQCLACSIPLIADRTFCFSCGRILRPTPAKFHRTDLVKIVAIIAVPILLMESIVAWPQAALFLSQRSLYLAATICALFPVVTILYVLERRKQRKVDTEFYQKLSMRNRQVIDTVRETERITVPKLHTIAVVYKKKTGEPIEDEEVLRRLAGAERTGIIEADVANVQDEPTQVWRGH
jgi:exosortase/archaeosortase family protein